MKPMSEHLPEGWSSKRIDDLGQLYSGATPSTHIDSYWGDEIVWVTPNDLSRLRARYIAESERRITALGLKNCSAHLLPKGSLIISSRAPIGYLAIAETDFCTNQGCKSLVFAPEQDPDFHYYNLSFRVGAIREKGEGTTFAEISKTALAAIEVPVPDDKTEQTAIADILVTVDRAIAQTEALIAKQRRIKAGLLHDLLTRGIDEHGQLRDPATHRFKQSAVGLVPEEWEVAPLEAKKRSDRPCIKTGPFGSSLKGKDWVETGVPVVTIGALGEGEFVRSELLFISESKAHSLAAYTVAPGDLLFSRVADVGRSAAVSEKEADWMMSSNLMRISLDQSKVVPTFAYLSLVHQRTRNQIRQAVNAGGRDVANTPILTSLQFGWPPYQEQIRIVRISVAQSALITHAQTYLGKLNRLKTGLMQDLLSGRVSVAGMADSEGRID